MLLTVNVPYCRGAGGERTAADPAPALALVPDAAGGAAGREGVDFSH